MNGISGAALVTIALALVWPALFKVWLVVGAAFIIIFGIMVLADRLWTALSKSVSDLWVRWTR